MEAAIILNQPVSHTWSMADLITTISNWAIEWAEAYEQEHPNISDEVWRLVAYDQARNLFDGEDDCILDGDDCWPTDFEMEVIVASYVYAALAYVQQHTVAAAAAQPAPDGDANANGGTA